MPRDMQRNYKAAARTVFLMALAVLLAGGGGCRSQGRNEYWLRSDSTGILYGPVGPVSDKEKDMFWVGRGLFHLTAVDADEMAVIKKLLEIKVVVDVRDMDIEAFVELLNNAQRERGCANGTVEISIEIPESWDTDVGQIFNGETVLVKARTFWGKVTMSYPDEKSIYEILIDLRSKWRGPQFHFRVEGTSVYLRVAEYWLSAGC